MNIVLSTKPVDWPDEGLIDLAIHDLPHQSSTTEWWYLNTHFETENGKQFSLFASFFRRIMGKDSGTQQPRYAHSVIWAITDVEAKSYHAVSMIDPDSPAIIGDYLDEHQREETLLTRALREILAHGHVPYPDQLITGDVIVDLERLHLDFGGNLFTKLDDGTYRLSLYASEQRMGCNLVFHPEKSAVRHGDGGLVRGVSNEGLFYYFIPRCKVEGSVILDDQPQAVTHGSGWYDHEFGYPTEAGDDNIAWNWISAQLDNGCEISAYDLYNTIQHKGAGRWAIVVDPHGQSRHYTNFNFEPSKNWTSVRTFNQYPLCWELTIPEAGITLTAEAALAEQEFITVISAPSFWEGRVQVTAEFCNQSVRGVGFIERSGYGKIETTEDFFAAVGRETRQAIQKLLPLNPTREHLARLIGEYGLDDVSPDQYVATVIKPLREIIDRGGKTWRSYALIACCELVGGNASKIADWLAVPELLHVGSLIVDDVQDKSPIRRGGPAAHVLYGEPLAINAGSAAYFIGQIYMSSAHLTPEQRLRIYDIYFATLRATHAGQAFDIDGVAGEMAEAIEGGDGSRIERRVLATHRLKSAIPARSLAMIGAIIGNGTEPQINALANYFEALGLAFQIVDDVLNLRGFRNNLKSRGEDIREGKITMPIAKALGRLTLTERRWLWETLAAKPSDPDVIGSVIDLLETCGALSACADQANTLIETAWDELSPLFRDSNVKLNLRAFGWYVLERHY
ncbi:MAG: polyprenyl synthetase family protein [Chloroflexota bacterium]